MTTKTTPNTSASHSLHYRPDIDGLRAIAVTAVILFHLGCLPHGYLGVDIFFVISGYLITTIIYNERLAGRFSLTTFYLRRIRRILPLLLIVTLVALSIGYLTMLPDDLENLGQSAVATNLSANNVLQYLTTRNYWDVVNDYKPLMHTWSLGIEEQFYFFYPFLFLLLPRHRLAWLLPVIAVLSLCSLGLYLAPFAAPAKFYLLPFRFFELSMGCMASLYLNGNLLKSRAAVVLTPLLLAVLVVPAPVADSARLLVSVVLSTLILSSNNKSWITAATLENRFVVYVGRISYSLYMWHQIVLSYLRYTVPETSIIRSPFCEIASIIVISCISYVVIEQPFRNSRFVPTRILLAVVVPLFLVTTLVGLYLNACAGVVRDVPELAVVASRSRSVKHSQYNDRIYRLDRDFTASENMKILIIGDSFARDWANIILEAHDDDDIEISYVYSVAGRHDVAARAVNSDVIYFSNVDKAKASAFAEEYGVDSDKIWCVGTKNFGENNGVIYNSARDSKYCKLRVRMQHGVYERNQSLKAEYGNRYVDLIELVIDKDGTVPVFTPQCHFISQDCRHLTQDGAVYFAELLRQAGFSLKK